jgi:phosphoribosylformylglycinamidine synthase subunit PurS
LRVKVFITPRNGILDPQGRAVESSLKSLGFAGVASVRVGRYITIDIDARSNAEAEAAVKKMCDQLLANPNIEDYRFEVDAESPRHQSSPMRPAVASGKTKINEQT